MVQLTSDWPHYHCRLGILFADLNIPPSAPASCCTPSAPLYIDFLCLLADPLWFEDTPSGFPVAERTHRWLAMLAVMACFLCSMCPALLQRPPPNLCTYLFHPLHYRHRYFPGQSGWSTCVCHFRPPGFPGCSPSRLLGPAFPVAVSRCLAFLVLPTRSAMMRFPFLVCMSLPPLSLFPMLLLPCLPTVMLRFLSRASAFLAFPPPLLFFTLNLPYRLAAAADAHSGQLQFASSFEFI
jgi:hypothetical protein